MWYNSYSYSTAMLSFIIWKDYNCQAYSPIGTNLDGALSTTFGSYQRLDITNAMSVFTATNIQNDIWGAALSYLDTLTGSTYFKDDGHAYTIVISQDSKDTYHGYACINDLKFFHSYYNNGYRNLLEGASIPYQGQFFLFQTR